MSNNTINNTDAMTTRSMKRGLAEVDNIDKDMSNTEPTEPKAKVRKTNTLKLEVKVKTKAKKFIVSKAKVPINKTKIIFNKTKNATTNKSENGNAVKVNAKKTIPTRASSIDSGIGLPKARAIPNKATLMILPPEVRIMIMETALELFIDDTPDNIDYLDRTNTFAYQTHFNELLKTLDNLGHITLNVKALQTDLLYVIKKLRAYSTDKLYDWHIVAITLRKQERSDIYNGEFCCANCKENFFIVHSNYHFVQMQEVLARKLYNAEVHLIRLLQA